MWNSLFSKLVNSSRLQSKLAYKRDRVGEWMELYNDKITLFWTFQRCIRRDLFCSYQNVRGEHVEWPYSVCGTVHGHKKKKKTFSDLSTKFLSFGRLNNLLVIDFFRLGGFKKSRLLAQKLVLLTPYWCREFLTCCTLEILVFSIFTKRHCSRSFKS